MPTTTDTLNGLNTPQLHETIDAIKAEPTLAKFEFRNSNKWIGGGHNQSKIQGFSGAGKEDDSRAEPFVLDNGEPPVFLGRNEGANPVEYLLHALAGCLTTSFVMHATARGIRVDSISTEIEGDMDIQGLLNLDPSVCPAYEQIRVRMDVKADCPDEELEELIMFARDHSPVVSSVRNPVPVHVERVTGSGR